MDLGTLVYGMRNLAVGDEEETRVEELVVDIEDPAQRAEVERLIALGEYETAYMVALTPLLLTTTREAFLAAVEEFISDSGWFDDYTEEEREEDEQTFREEAIAEFDRRAHLAREADRAWREQGGN